MQACADNDEFDEFDDEFDDNDDGSAATLGWAGSFDVSRAKTWYVQVRSVFVAVDLQLVDFQNAPRIDV